MKTGWQAMVVVLFLAVANGLTGCFSILVTYWYEWVWPAWVIYLGYFPLIVLLGAGIYAIGTRVRLNDTYAGVCAAICCFAFFFGSDFPGASWLQFWQRSVQGVDFNHPQELDGDARIYQLSHARIRYDWLGKAEVHSVVKSANRALSYQIPVVPVTSAEPEQGEEILFWVVLSRVDQNLDKVVYFTKGRRSAVVDEAIQDAVKRHQILASEHPIVLEPQSATESQVILAQTHQQSLVFFLILNAMLGVPTFAMRRTLWARG